MQQSVPRFKHNFSTGNQTLNPVLSLTIAILIFCVSGMALAQSLDMDIFHGLKARSIGPAGMSGRVTAIDVVLKQPEIIYIGTASGGVWRSESGGIAWEPIFDNQPFAAIGAIAIDQNIPDVIWVGTGEGNPRNSQSSGNGIYKSIDGGRTWLHLGLELTRNIHRVIIHPQNSEIVYVAAQGPAWGENPERGIFKTTDGGKTWKKVLFVNNKTGAGDLVIDPFNPNKLYAAMWEYRRWPWFFKSGGTGSGLYITFDGGETWQEKTKDDGLPEGEIGRIGLAVARNQPGIVYALIEAKKNGLYRSDDGGMHWRKTADQNIGNRPFYYAEIYVDPENENRIYNLYSIVTMSEDGGKTFEPLIPWQKVHPDHHAWWIHPQNGNYIIDGNDGGLAISHDRGKTWRFVENLPLAQFYHINYDFEHPYNVYGGMQDNGSWKGPSRVYRRDGIVNSYWQELSFGDGFDVVPDSSDSRYGYTMSQGGNVYRYDSETGDLKFIQPFPPEGEELRFNWNAAIAHDPFNQHTIYYGSQYVHRSADRGDSWAIISPDLTTNDPEKQKQMDSGGLNYDVTTAENFTTIISIAPSPLNKDMIWVGTDDGNVQLTRDGGKTWSNQAKNMKGLPKFAWVAQVHASEYKESEAFAVINNYRQNDWNLYVYHTDNYGKSWEPIVKKDQVEGYALSFAQDPEVPNLFFLGTESGLYLSIDSGLNWTKWTQGYPTVSTMDMKIHPRDNDLIIGTFGRSAYIIDDITAIRSLAKTGISIFNTPLQLMPILDAELEIRSQPPGGRFIAEAEFKGENRPYGAMITCFLNPDTSVKQDTTKVTSGRGSVNDSVKIEILDQNRKVIRTLMKSPKIGINRFYWGLDRAGIRFPNSPKPKPDAPEPGGPSVIPGTYLVRLTHGDFRDSTDVTVKFDHRIDATTQNLIERHDILESFIPKIELTNAIVDQLAEMKKTINLVSEKLAERNDDQAKKIKETGKALQDSIKKLDELINQEEVQGIRYDPAKVASRLSRAYREILSSSDPLGEREKMNLRLAEQAVSDLVEKVNPFIETDWKNYRELVETAPLSLFEEVKPFVPFSD